MRKSILFSAAVLMIGLLFGSQAMAQGRIDLRGAKSAQECANVSKEGFTATFSFGSIVANEVNTERGVFSELTMDGTYPTGNAGEPSLPAAHQLIAVPYGASNVTVNVVGYSTTEYNLADFNINTIVPQQPSVRKDQKPEDITFFYSEQAYANRGYAERDLVEFELQGNLRGIQVGSLTINPVAYNPTRGSIKVYNDIQVEVRYNDYDQVAAESEFVRTFSPYFVGVYRQMFNWRDDVYDEHPDLWNAPVKMLVIANRMFEDCMQDWIEWKTLKGFYMDVNYTDEIGTSASAIRSFIQSKYAEDAPSFVIIFGDKEQVAASATGSQTSKVTDLNYSSVDSDYYPDIFHSRMCAQTVEQMQNIITKTLWYERDQFLSPNRNTDYLSNVLLIAGWDSSWNPTVAQPTINYATTYYYNAEHGLNDVNVFLQQPYSNCYASLNTGVSFVNYTAHGSETGWYEPGLSVSNCSSFTNEGMPFLAMGNCCLAADWGYSSVCFGEAMIRTNTRGAYAYIGSCPSTYWYEDYYFGVGATNTHGGATPTVEESSTGVYDGTWMDDTYNTVSSIPFLGNLAVCYAHAGNYQTHSNPTYYWQAYHALGDGSVMPFRIEPTDNDVSHMPTLPIGIDFFNVSAYPGSYVAISKDGVLHGVGLIGEEGSADITIEPVLSGGDVTICVTHPQHVPYIATIPAASLEGAYIVYNNVQCDNTVSGATVNPIVTLKNVGVQTANNINVTLSTESEYITMVNYNATVASLGPDATVDINDFVFDVANYIPNGTKVQFFVTCTSGSDVWESKFNLTFSAPEFAVDDISNTDLNPGGSATITFALTNVGEANANDAIFQVYSSSDDLTFENNVYELGTIAAGATVTIDVNLTVGSNVEIGSTYEIPYLLNAGHYAIDGSYIVTVGNIVEGFETGDFSMYNWQFGGSANWVIVTGEANSGDHSAKSGSISNSQQSDLILTVDILANGVVSFYKKVSSESNYDKLHFYIDNAEQDNWSGEVAWSMESYAVTTGTHTFKWSYTKDGSVSNGSDCAWVDDIQFPPTNVTSALDPVNNLEATISGNNVSLTWDAASGATAYIIRRNGQELANQAGTTYNDNVADGVYTYSVVATDGNGHYSTASYITVNVGTVGVEENTIEGLSIYPNPVNNTLYVNGGNAEYSYMMFNGMGQMVANGNANGNAEINVSGMAKGVYFLRLTTGTQVRVEKVVVE